MNRQLAAKKRRTFFRAVKWSFDCLVKKTHLRPGDIERVVGKYYVEGRGTKSAATYTLDLTQYGRHDEGWSMTTYIGRVVRQRCRAGL